MLEVTFEVWPDCGDGLTLEWTVQQGEEMSLLYAKAFPAVPHSAPHRQTVERTVTLTPGDSMFFGVKPGANHDCDGVYVHDIKVWESKAT